MDTHFAVLPLDVVDSVVSQLSSTSSPTRFLRLPHPRTGIASLFLPHQTDVSEKEAGGKRTSKILEVQAVSPPNARSWFMGDQVISDGKLLVMTPVDPLFLLVPILRTIKPRDGETINFRPADDIFEEAAMKIAEISRTSSSQDASTLIEPDDIIRFAALDCTMGAMKRLCEVKEITSEITVFRYSSEKLMQHLRIKVAALSHPRITEMSRSLIRSLAKDGLMDDRHEDILDLGRRKLACELLAQYLPQDVQEELVGSYDFTKLDNHVKALQADEMMIPPDTTAKKSKSTSGTEDGNKKRKKDSKASQGVEKLKKANVSGMSKLSSFFTKKTG